MDRKASAKETIEIIKQGYYFLPQKKEQKENRKQIEIGEDIQQSVEKSLLFTPKQGEELLQQYKKKSEENKKVCSNEKRKVKSKIENISTVDAIQELYIEGKREIGVLNFASAKNPGGGFLNGAKAQEESLAVSSSLYYALIQHGEYYEKNREQNSMMYTDYGIYAPEVVFFRDGKLNLVEEPAKASVLTMPAVNMGQVKIKGEDICQAEAVMRRRMKLVLCIFANQGAKNLVLGAYGCGVFRNEPQKIALWWKELLEEGMENYFDSIVYAVLDNSKNQVCIRAFEDIL